tara:strand:- start:1943 stop:2839 length:897 start_codon:yes stop_codon:yes gene_type:complete
LAIGIDPTVDFAFKKLLGSPEHPAVTLHFLNAILGGDPLITEVDVLNPFLEKDFEGDKLSILDILARDERGQLFNIEMQTALSTELPERLAFYASSLFVGQIGQGDSYHELCPAIGICVLNDVMIAHTPEIHHDFRLRCGEALLTNHLQIHLLELPKYALPSDNKKITEPIEEWMFFFRQVENLTADEVAKRLDDPTFVEAVGVLEMIARSPEERDLYEARLKMQRDEEARLRYAKNQGLEEGREEGIRRGNLAGRIQLLQELLGESVTEMAVLETQDIAELTAAVAVLQRRLRDRDA